MEREAWAGQTSLECRERRVAEAVPKSPAGPKKLIWDRYSEDEAPPRGGHDERGPDSRRVFSGESVPAVPGIHVPSRVEKCPGLRIRHRDAHGDYTVPGLGAVGRDDSLPSSRSEPKYGVRQLGAPEGLESPIGSHGSGSVEWTTPPSPLLTPQSRESRESRESRVEALGLARVGEWAKSKGPSSILGAEISGSIYGGVAVLPVEPLSGSLASKVNSAGVCESLPAGLTPSSCTATLAVGIELLNLGVVQGRDCGGSCPVRGSDNDPFWHLKRRGPAHCRAAP